MSTSQPHRADPSRRSPTENHARWHKHYIRLAAFVEKHGRYPNALFATPEERALRSWCSTQRNAHNGLGTGTLTPKQDHLLEQLPGWTW